MSINGKRQQFTYQAWSQQVWFTVDISDLLIFLDSHPLFSHILSFVHHHFLPQPYTVLHQYLACCISLTQHVHWPHVDEIVGHFVHI